MTNMQRPHRIAAVFLGVLETVSLTISGLALMSMGGDALDRLFSAFAFYVLLPVGSVIGILLGLRFGGLYHLGALRDPGR